MESRLLSCNPPGSTCMSCYFPICCHSIFHDNIGTPRSDVMEKNLIQRITFLFQYPGDHRNAMCSQALNSFPCHKRIRIIGTDDYSSDSLFDNCLRTGRRFAIMTTRFQCHVDCSAFHVFPAVCNGIPFRMQFPASVMIALADYPSIFHNHRTDHGVRIRPPHPPDRFFQSDSHIVFMVHTYIS